MILRFGNIVLSVVFLVTSCNITTSYAGEMVMPPMPKPGAMVDLSPAFTPAILKGISIHPDNALKFDFIVHRGDGNLSDPEKKIEYNKLIKYFLASLAVPDKDQWVNLSPYEKDRIIDDDFGKTEMGRDLLAQDYLLKQITSSLIYPEQGLGKKFWDEVYARAYAKYGNTNIPVNTFNKVWIVPDKATIYEKGNAAYVLENHLKVMLEEDYLSLNKHSVVQNDQRTVSSNVIREVVLPALEKEVNTGKNFALLRQVYSSMLLAAWYKRALKESLLGKVYADKSKVNGVDQNPKNNQAIYEQYLQAFKKGVFNYVKEETDADTQQLIPRKYFSGGTEGFKDFAQIATRTHRLDMAQAAKLTNGMNKDDEAVITDLVPSTSAVSFDAAMTAKTILTTATGLGILGIGGMFAGHEIHNITLAHGGIALFGATALGLIALKYKADGKGVSLSEEFSLAWLEPPFLEDSNVRVRIKSKSKTAIYGTLAAPSTIRSLESRYNVDGMQVMGFDYTFSDMQKHFYEFGPNDLLPEGEVLRFSFPDTDTTELFLGNIKYIRSLEGDQALDRERLSTSRRIGSRESHAVEPINSGRAVYAETSERPRIEPLLTDANRKVVLNSGVVARESDVQNAVDLLDAFSSKNRTVLREIHTAVVENKEHRFFAVNGFMQNGRIREDIRQIVLASIRLLAGNWDSRGKFGVVYPVPPPVTVVQIFSDKRRKAGTAFAVGEDAKSYYFLTNWHVVKASFVPLRIGQMISRQFRRVQIIYDENGKVRTFWGSPVAFNRKKDIALFKVSKEDLPDAKVAQFGATAEREAHFYGMETTLRGVINRFEEPQDGLSGGAIITGSGKVIGMTKTEIDLDDDVRLMSMLEPGWSVKRMHELTNKVSREDILSFLEKEKVPGVSDNFQITEAKSMSDVGGIDMNAANVNLTIKRDGKGVPLPLAQQDMAQLGQIQGFVPNIIEIRPVINSPLFSELQRGIQASQTTLASAS